MAGGCSVQPGVIELCGARRRRGEGFCDFWCIGGAGLSLVFIANYEEFKRELRLFLVHWVFLFIFADCLAEGL